MILNSLKLTNFRVFKGIHEFSLAPKSRDGHQAPIILFGGLNGAGKTTTLTAIRTALYGRQSLGVGTSQKEYHQFLTDSVHTSKVTGVQANSAAVELSFSYAKLGVINQYHVHRSWTVINKKVSESLRIFQDECPIQDLTPDQAQGFLNELVPIGVSDLFFFDGEKIAQLADDDEGYALSESVKKLIGLDLIEKLIADITVYISNQNKQKLSDDIKSKIIGLEQLLEMQESITELKKHDFESLKLQEVHAAKLIDQYRNNLNIHGGAWAASRENEIKKLTSYNTEKEMYQAQIRDGISNSFPFSIAPDFVSKCLIQLNNESNLKQNKNIASVLSNHIASLKAKLSSLIDQQSFSTINDTIDLEFAQLVSPSNAISIIHDVSDTLHQKISAVLLDATTHQRDGVERLVTKLKVVNQKIDDAGVNIARAPEQELLNLRLKELNDAQESHTELVGQLAQLNEIIRTHLRESIKTARNLEKLYGDHIDSADDNRALDYAYKAKNSLIEFANRVAIDKIKRIESEFIHSFRNLARKDDININARIEPISFSVKLLNNFGQEIPKESLSAGERQIYAIAMLDALAKTSGRKLPIIIDTPLGRLDSKHRKKLVENYFPYASHQVIILSTDTEIGESYLATLQEHISHSIMLDYSGIEGSSSISKGYFWNSKEAS